MSVEYWGLVESPMGTKAWHRDAVIYSTAIAPEPYAPGGLAKVTAEEWCVSYVAEKSGESYLWLSQEGGDDLAAIVARNYVVGTILEITW